jgi:rubrerythrin
MAIRSEENGAKFYRRAAELYSGKGKDATLLLDLARMEDGHKATFEAMRAELDDSAKESTAFDPYMEATMYLNAMSDGSKIEGAPSAAAELTGEETMSDILQIAIGLEKAAVLFYIGLRDMVTAKLGGDRIADIIAEEKQHIVQLTSALKAEQGE